jgi:outer membrane cobalamin receptor
MRRDRWRAHQRPGAGPWKASLRFENITNARYQDVYNFGTTGRAVYAGLTATW